MAGRAPDGIASSAPRFVIELIAWVATPWALWSHSIALAIASVVLIGIPALVGMPGVKNQPPALAVGPVMAIVAEFLQPVAAVISSGVAWSWPAAIGVVAFALAMLVLQVPRWRWMLDRQ
jgi:hypothetical protein